MESGLRISSARFFYLVNSEFECNETCGKDDPCNNLILVQAVEDEDAVAAERFDEETGCGCGCSEGEEENARAWTVFLEPEQAED